MTFEEIYLRMKNSSQKLRDDICEATGMAKETFYKKRRDNSWTKSEMVLIAQLMEERVEDLFPGKFENTKIPETC